MAQITKLFVSILFLSFACLGHTKAQDSVVNNILINIEPISDRYLLQDTVSIFILNDNDKAIYFAVSIAENIGGKWMPVVFDIFRHNRDRYKARNIGVILPGERKQIFVPFSKYFNREVKPMGLCRFSVEVREEPLKEGKRISSSEFLID